MLIILLFYYLCNGLRNIHVILMLSPTIDIEYFELKRNNLAASMFGYILLCSFGVYVITVL